MTKPYEFPKAYGDFKRDDELQYGTQEVFGSYRRPDDGAHLVVSRYGRKHHEEEGVSFSKRLAGLVLAVEQHGLVLPDGFSEIEPDRQDVLAINEDEEAGLWIGNSAKNMLARFMKSDSRRSLAAFATIDGKTAGILAVPTDPRTLGRIASPFTEKEKAENKHFPMPAYLYSLHSGTRSTPQPPALVESPQHLPTSQED